MSAILHAKAQQYYWEGQESLSIKTFSAGRALYTLGHGYYAVDDSSYFVVNHDQPYIISIDADVEVESFCIFFDQDLARDVYRNNLISPERLLDEPQPRDSTLPYFFRTHL